MNDVWKGHKLSWSPKRGLSVYPPSCLQWESEQTSADHCQPQQPPGNQSLSPSVSGDNALWWWQQELLLPHSHPLFSPPYIFNNSALCLQFFSQNFLVSLLDKGLNVYFIEWNRFILCSTCSNEDAFTHATVKTKFFSETQLVLFSTQFSPRVLTASDTCSELVEPIVLKVQLTEFLKITLS